MPMAKVDPIPNDDILRQRRKPKWVVDPADVKAQDEIRARKWALGVMSKNEHRLQNTVPVGTIVYRKEVTPEEIDIKNVYVFEDMNYFIMKQSDNRWVLRLLYRTKSGNYSILAEFGYATIDHI